MRDTSKSSVKQVLTAGKQYSYTEIVEYLDSHWNASSLHDVSRMKQLDKAVGNVTKNLDVITIAGTNGKSLTTHFTAKLLKEEGLTVGTFYTPHILTYNERISLNNEIVSNKIFTELANEVLTAAVNVSIEPSSLELLTTMALAYFKKQQADVVLLELSESGAHHPVAVCSPKIMAITRITDMQSESAQEAQERVTQILSTIKKDTHVVSADQSKMHLQVMQDITTQQGGVWAMPIRKLAALSYPFEQLHGRCAALAERIACIYINTFADKQSISAENSLLTKQEGKRGRPTLDAKRRSLLNPKKTLEQFWKETENSLPGRFQLLDKEKPTILLDNANNLDAFKNILLGARLLHYKRPLKGLTVILGCNNESIDMPEFLKLLRYFFKKTSGQVIVCPAQPAPGNTGQSWDIEKVTNDIKSMKIKARSASSFSEAFQAAQKSVDERHGLVVITGSQEVVSEYWRQKGIKKI